MLARIIDSHIHLWDLNLKKHSWLLGPVGESFLGDYTPLQKNYLFDDYLKDTQNYSIEKVVHVQAGWDREDPLGEVQWLTEMNNPLLGAIVAYADLSSAHAEENLEALAKFSLVKAIRQLTAWHKNPFYNSCEKDFLNDTQWQKNFSLLEKFNLCFDLQIFPEQVDVVLPLLKKHPSISVVVEHLLQPYQHDAFAHWQTQLKKLAALPNVFLKLSGVNLFTHDQNFANAFAFIDTAIETFSPERCMFGSNFPVEKLYISFDELMERFLKCIQHYSASEKEMMLVGCANAFYSLG